MKFAGKVLSYIMVGLLAMVVLTFVFGKRPMRDRQSRGQKAAAAPARHPGPHELHTAATLRGRPVESPIGENLGRVDDLVIDPRSGRVVFVLLTSGGFAGMGAQLKPAPPTALSQATAKRGVLALTLEPKRWNGAPVIEKEHLSQLETPAQVRAIYNYYGQSLPSPTGRDDSKEKSHDLKLASDLIGQTVVNQRNEEVGRVADLKVDLANPTNTQAIFEPDGAGGRVAVPVNAFIVRGEGNSLILQDTWPHVPHAQSAVADLAPEAISFRSAREDHNEW